MIEYFNEDCMVLMARYIEGDVEMTKREAAMKEIEQAINLISEGEIDYSGTYNCELNERVTEVILNALREQAEREKGCEYCEPACKNCKHDIYDDFCQHYGSNGCNKAYYEPKHDYCPMCGKRLEVEHE